MLMWPGKSSKWIIARKKTHHFLTMKYDDGSSSRSEISPCRRRCCFATVSLSIQRSSLWMMGQILDSRQNHVTKLQRFPLSPNDFIYDAMTWPHWTILGGSICWSFRPKKALGWKLQDIETHDITGKKTSPRRVVVASRSWEILFRLTSSTLSHAMFRPWWPRLESARDLLAVLDGVNWKKSSSLWIQLELGWALIQNYYLFKIQILQVFNPIIQNRIWIGLYFDKNFRELCHSSVPGSQGGSWGQSSGECGVTGKSERWSWEARKKGRITLRNCDRAFSSQLPAEPPSRDGAAWILRKQGLP